MVTRVQHIKRKIPGNDATIVGAGMVTSMFLLRTHKY